MKHFTLLELVSTNSEMEAERINAHKYADSLDSKSATEAYLIEHCPHCSFGKAFGLADMDAKKLSPAEKRELQDLGEFCAEIASSALGAHSFLIPPDKVFDLIFNSLLIGVRIGRKQATEELTSFRGKIQ